MIFLYPAFLFALFATAIPVIIHLYNFRRYKTVLFSNVAFLKSIRQETKASSQLRHWLVLLMRILTIACLVIAFAQPLIPAGDQGQANTDVAGIYLDNSFSMEGQGEAGKMLEMAKNKARRVVSAFRPGTRYLYTDNDFAPQHQHLVSRQQVLDLIMNAELSPASRAISEVYARQNDFFKQNLPSAQSGISAFFISDFQKATTDPGQIPQPGSLRLNLVPVASQAAANIYIDSCWFESPTRQYNQPDELKIRVVNTGDQAYQNIPLKLYLNDTLKSVSGFNINPGESLDCSLAFTNTQKGWINGRVEVTDYPVTFDNSSYFTFYIAETIPVQVINYASENRYLTLLFSGDPYFPLTNTRETNLNYSGLPAYPTLVLNEPDQISSGLAEALKNYVSGGGTLAVIPSKSMELSPVNAFLATLGAGAFAPLDTTRTSIDRVNYQSALFKGSVRENPDRADYPVVFAHYPIVTTGTGSEVLLSTTRNHPFLVRTGFGKGQVYLFGSPLRPESGNFVKHALFVPALFNLALQSIPSTRMYYTIGRDDAIDLQPFDISDPGGFRITGQDTRFDLIPETRKLEGVFRLFIQQNIKKSGNYAVHNGDQPVGSFAFNYDRKESVPAFYGADDLKKLIRQAGNARIQVMDTPDEALPGAIVRASQGTALWKWFIIGALLFLVLELLLVRLPALRPKTGRA